MTERELYFESTGFTARYGDGEWIEEVVIEVEVTVETETIDGEWETSEVSELHVVFDVDTDASWTVEQGQTIDRTARVTRLEYWPEGADASAESIPAHVFPGVQEAETTTLEVFDELQLDPEFHEHVGEDCEPLERKPVPIRGDSGDVISVS